MELKGKKFVVVGGAGLIGSHTVDQLLEEDKAYKCYCSTERLEKMRETVDQKLQETLEKKIGESFNLVRKQLDAVHKGLGEMQTVAADVGDLKNVLSNVKNKGVFGEYQLGNILEQILMLGE